MCITFFLAGILVYVKAFELSNTSKTWTEAADQCELLVTPVQYTANGNVLNVGNNLVLGPEGAWLGYYMTWTAFEYIGCVSRTAVSVNNTLEIVDDPGQCYSACNFSQYFGLVSNECFCLDYQDVESFNDKRRMCFQCSSKFFGSQGPACGNKRDDNVALYKVNDDVLQDSNINERGSQDRDELCLEYSPETGSLIWATCNRALQVMCQTDSGVVIIFEGISLATWITAMIKCMRNGSDPTTFMSSKSVTSTSSTSLWTGVVRSRVIRSHIQDPIDTRTGKKWFGYVTKKERYWLNFTEEHAQKRFLCDGDVHGTSPSVTEGHSSTTGSDTSGTVPQSTGLDTSGTVPQSTGLDNAGTVPNSDGLVVPVYVIVIVAVAFLVLLAVIVFIVVWKSRNAKMNRKSQQTLATNEQGDYIQPDNDFHTASSHQYEHLKHGHPQPAYSHLTPASTNTDVGQTRTLTTTGNAYVSSHMDYLNPVCDDSEDNVYTSIPDTAIGDEQRPTVDNDYETPRST